MPDHTRTTDIDIEVTEMHKMMKDYTGWMHHRGFRGPGRHKFVKFHVRTILPIMHQD